MKSKHRHNSLPAIDPLNIYVSLVEDDAAESSVVDSPLSHGENKLLTYLEQSSRDYFSHFTQITDSSVRISSTNSSLENIPNSYEQTSCYAENKPSETSFSPPKLVVIEDSFVDRDNFATEIDFDRLSPISFGMFQASCTL